MTIKIRNLNKDKDLEKFVEFYNLAHADYPTHRTLTAEVIKEYIFDKPEFDEQGHYIAFDGSKFSGIDKIEIEYSDVEHQTIDSRPYILLLIIVIVAVCSIYILRRGKK